jgi:hypothetical protein
MKNKKYHTFKIVKTGKMDITGTVNYERYNYLEIIVTLKL